MLLENEAEYGKKTNLGPKIGSSFVLDIKEKVWKMLGLDLKFSKLTH